MITPLERARQAAPGADGAPARAARPPLAGRETALLITLALITEAVYLFGFVLPYPLAGNYIHPLLDLNRLNNHSPVSANYFALTWAISFAAMYIAYRRCPAAPSRAYFVALGAAALLFNLTLLFMYPTGAADLFDQIFRARELAVYGKNPFVFAPNDPIFAQDPFRPFVGGWAGTTSPYGPAWESLAAITSKLAGDDLWRNILYFKGLVILAYAGAAALIYATLRRTRPDWAARGLLFFAWNPLLLWETAGNGHNDMVMILFTALALYLLAARGRLPLLAPVALGLAALSKFVPALLLPLALVALWQMRQAPVGAPPEARRAGRRAGAQAAILGLAGFLLISLLVYAPFWAGPRTIGALARQDLFTASIPNSLKDTLVERFSVDEAQAMQLARSGATLVVALTVIGCALWLLYATRGAGRRDVLEATFGAAYTVFFVYLVFGTLWFQPWYQGWLIALTPLTARWATGKRTLVMNAGGVANYFVWDFLVLWNYSWGSVIQWTSALTVNLPVLLYTIYQWLVPEQGAQAAGRPPPEEEGMQHL